MSNGEVVDHKQNESAQGPVLPTWFNLDDAEYVSLFLACIWVGSGGRTVSSEEVAKGDLLEEGAKLLFAKLSEGGWSADGIDLRKRKREPIPSNYWELAAYNPPFGWSGHEVEFLDKRETGEGVLGGILRPFDHREPGWHLIRLRRAELLAKFAAHLTAGSLASLKRALDLASRYMRDNRHAELTRQEAETVVLKRLFPKAKRKLVRIAAAAKIPPRDRRRPSGNLLARATALENCIAAIGLGDKGREPHSGSVA